MTSKERMLLAMTGKTPDRVPVAPDISNMIPCRLTGKPFWDIYLHGNPPLWKAYLAALEHFKFDGWFIYGYLDLEMRSDVQYVHEIVSRDVERIVRRTTIKTPKGDMTQADVFRVADPPAPIEMPVKSVADFPKLLCLYPEITGYRTETLEGMRKELGDRGVLGLCVGLPGFQSWMYTFQGGVEAITYLYYDRPDLIHELRDVEARRALRVAEMSIEAKPDFILIGASGLMTLQSPSIFRDLSLDTLKKVTRMCKQAGVPTMLHSCGIEKELVKVCAEETDLDCINPLEEPPMGDCDLAELKKLYGKRISLMGNVNTTFPMLLGTPDDVRRAAMKCLEAAKAGGGFILSTGDQCGRDTPDENLFAFVETAKAYGKY